MQPHHALCYNLPEKECYNLEKGHLWGIHDVAIPIDYIDAYNGQVVSLKLDKKAVNDLPRLTVKWH